MHDRKELSLPNDAPDELAIRVQRLTEAETFLNTVLIPQIESGSLQDHENLDLIYQNYVDENGGIFDLATVLGKVRLITSKNEAFNASASVTLESTVVFKTAEELLTKAVFGNRD